MAKKKKTFKTKNLKRAIILEKLTYLIPIYVLLKCLIEEHEVIAETLRAEPTMSMYIGVAVFILLFTFLTSLVPFVFLRVILYFYKRRIIKNNTFISINDFEYYREKLNGLTPASISLLTDLEIDRKKDIAASILRYENLGVIKLKEDGKYEKTDLYDTCDRLYDSDRYLINKLVQGTLNMYGDAEWERRAIEEAKKDGYLVSIFGTNIGNKKYGCFNSGCLIPLIFFAIWIVWLFNFCSRGLSTLELLNEVPDGASISYQINFILQNPSLILAIAELLGLITCTIIVMQAPFIVLVYAIATLRHFRTYRRSKYGNEIAECIFGMKNFIHDFSNLKEAEREHVVLWDDYLVYAVVLEENEKIVKEITDLRNKVVNRQN